MSAISDKYNQSELRNILGQPTTEEQSCPDGVGRFRHFQGGSIYWTPVTGAHIVWGGILNKWRSMGGERSPLGYPMTDEMTTPDGQGRYNHFQGGSIYWTHDTNAHVIWGAIRGKWASVGWERSPLGYPTTDEMTTPDGQGRYNHFQGGSIYWTPDTGPHIVWGAIRDLWASLGWERSYLGYPVTDELAPPGKLRCQKFQKGAITFTPQDGAKELPRADTYYLIGINSFHIGCTRSKFTDTDHIKIVVAIDGVPLQDLPVMHVGDVRDGDHLVDLYYPPITLPKKDSVVTFNYNISNIGNGDYTAIENGMSEAAKAGLTAWLGPVGGGIAEIADKIYHIFNASCDGPVAVDQISATGYLLDSWTAGSNIHSETRYYTGQSQYFCGADYKYWVTWSIIRL